VDGFARWLERHDEPFAAWIHLDEPHVAARDGADYAAAVSRVDGAIARVREMIGRRGGDSPTGIIVVGTHGELLGAHGGITNRTLYDEVVHVPLLMSLPGLPIDAPVVAPQVRTMDVAATIADWLRAPSLDESEGIALTGYVAGTRAATIWCSLVGRDLQGRWILGLRNNGVKVVRKPEGGEELYDLRRDPGERENRSAEQREVITQARSLLASDAAALDAWLR
jgi:arylsulfatase A-like enzyme